MKQKIRHKITLGSKSASIHPHKTKTVMQSTDQEKEKEQLVLQQRCVSTCVNNCGERGLVCPAVSHAAADAASEALQKYLRKSRKISIRREDLKLLRHLGEGGFCDVDEVTYQERLCAVKKLRHDTKLEKDQYIGGAMDLANEAGLLTKLNHENIIKVHGMASGSVRKVVEDTEDGFFLVMEKLARTLDEQIYRWKAQEETRRTRQDRLKHRVQVGLQVAKAVEYLHQQKIVHRDLKPGNIGFDTNGVVKVFDFGIAEQLKRGGMLTDKTGTLKYMAPETLLKRPYNQAADVYAFGLLLWHICALKTPYLGCSQEDMEEKVAKRGKREVIPRWWPRKIKTLIQDCWNGNPTERPKMGEVVEALEEFLQ